MKARYTAKAVVIATGTFLGGRIFVGDVSFESGPDGMFPAAFGGIAEKLGLSLRRLKPVRRPVFRVGASILLSSRCRRAMSLLFPSPMTRRSLYRTRPCAI